MLIISVTPAVVAVPEGPPLAVTLMFAFAAKRMTAEKILIRTRGSCDTGGRPLFTWQAHWEFFESF